ncbi:early transcription elongation factor of RNA pol II, NGN section-domain-containing protein [Infundibulicybe gibba]|nr:early transcription elongation factor of RNA pol II, NGN section-domain-containing protein [Infundibulicybe gibba]
MSDIEDQEHMYQGEPDEGDAPMLDTEDVDAVEEEEQPQRDAFGDEEGEEEEEEEGNFIDTVEDGDEDATRLWQVRVKPGRERDTVFSLMRKSIDVEYTNQPLQILSAFQRDSLPGMIYVEARSSKQVSQAYNGLVGVYPSRGIQLVPIEEMASLLQTKKQDLVVTPGSWVRIRHGKYAGDLAQVMDITENGEDVGLKFIPRIDLNPRDDGSGSALDARKRKKGRLFNYEEIIKVWGRKHVSRRRQAFVFRNDTYKDGFIEKDFRLSALILEDVNPTLDEITQFTRRQDGVESGDTPTPTAGLSIIAEASRKAAISVLQPGDHVEVFEGEQAGVHGVMDEIVQDVVTITAVGVDIDGQKVELLARSVRKRFKPGDHNADETGSVVSVADNVVTFLSDMPMREASVFSKDLREAAAVGSGTNIVGNYELHDLIYLQTVGVTFKTERDSFRVLDQNGQVRLVQPHQISMRRDSTRAIAMDSEGRVLHIHQSFFGFLHKRDIPSMAVSSSPARAPSRRSLPRQPGEACCGSLGVNPALVAPVGGMAGSGAMGRGPRDRHIDVMVVAVKGPYKGYVGTIKDTNGRYAANAGGKTPRGAYGRTPHASSATPAWTPSRTPNPYTDGSKTPAAWNAHSRTPNPDISGRAPRRRAAVGGGRDTRAGDWGNATPGGRHRRLLGWGQKKGARPRGPCGPNCLSTPGFDCSAPTPAAPAATPGFTGAPTPMAAPTPAALNTPASYSFGSSGGGNSAPTPGIAPHTYEEHPTLTRLLVEISGTKAGCTSAGRVAGFVRVASEFEQR